MIRPACFSPSPTSPLFNQDSTIFFLSAYSLRLNPPAVYSLLSTLLPIVVICTVVFRVEVPSLAPRQIGGPGNDDAGKRQHECLVTNQIRKDRVIWFEISPSPQSGLRYVGIACLALFGNDGTPG